MPKYYREKTTYKPEPKQRPTEETFNILINKNPNLKTLIGKFGLEFLDEENGEYLSTKDLLNLKPYNPDENRIDIDSYLETIPNNLKNNTMGKATKKEVTEPQTKERKEVEISDIPFFKFETVGETFKGTLTGSKNIKFADSGPEGSKVYIANDSTDGTEVLLPTNAQLNIKLGLVEQNNQLPIDIEIEYTGTVKTAKGQAKQYKVYTL